MNRAVFIVVAVLVTACSAPVMRGDFALLSTENLEGKYEVLSDQELTGRACFKALKMSVLVEDSVFDRAVRAALAGRPEGTLLVNAEFVDHGTCIHVTGLPAALK